MKFLCRREENDITVDPIAAEVAVAVDDDHDVAVAVAVAAKKHPAPT